MRVRLTDQALVAVTSGRRVAAGARGPSVADLALAVMSEPDGAVGSAPGTSPAAVASLATRVPSASPRLPSDDVAIGWAAREVEDRPVWTSDLLVAALEVGAGDLADLLEAAGVDLPGLTASLPRPDPLPRGPLQHPEDLAETYGLDITGGGPLDRPTARAVARVRALGGGAVTLVAALAVEAVLEPDAVPIDADEVDRRLGVLHRRRATQEAPADVSLDAVVEAACRIRRPGEEVRPVDLLRAIVLVGGPNAAGLVSDEVVA